MSNLDPQLQAVEQRYDDVFAAYQSGQIAADAASRYVSEAVVTDAAGTQWGLTPQRIWWCQPAGRGPQENADPSTFATSAPTPISDAFPPNSGFHSRAEDVFGTPPSFAQDSPPQLFPMSDLDSADSGGYQGLSSPGQPSRSLGDDDHEPEGKKSTTRANPLSGITAKLPSMDGLFAKLPVSKRTAIIIVAAVALVIMAFMLKPSGETSSSPASPSGSASSPAPVAESPSEADASRVVETIQAGRLGEAVVGNKGAPLSQAAWAGSGAVAFKVTPAALASNLTQKWTVVDASGAPVTVVTVKWVKTDSGWKIAELPNIIP